MSLLFPCHIASPPLSWAEHLWLREISPTNENFITTVFEHRNNARKNHEILALLPEAVAAIKHDEPTPQELAEGRQP